MGTVAGGAEAQPGLGEAPAAAAAEAEAADLADACAGAGLHASACAGAASAGLLGGATLPGVTSIILTRDTDGALIPYDSVHGITLITGLRLGLLAPLRARAYHQFLSLPLRIDQTPWNVVFLGSRLEPPHPGDVRTGGDRVRTLVMRIAERAVEHAERPTLPLWGAWQEGSVTFDGRWCEPLSVDLVRRLNRDLATAKRAAPAKGAT